MNKPNITRIKLEPSGRVRATVFVLRWDDGTASYEFEIDRGYRVAEEERTSGDDNGWRTAHRFKFTEEYSYRAQLKACKDAIERLKEVEELAAEAA